MQYNLESVFDWFHAEMLILFYIVLERPICVNLMGDSKQDSREKKKKRISRKLQVRYLSDA